MVNKFKVSLLAWVAMCSFSVFAEEYVSGFYIEIEVDDDTVSIWPRSVTVELCPVNAAATCVAQPFFTDIPVFVPFGGEANVYLKKIEMNTPTGTREIKFNAPFKNCIVDPNTRVYSSVEGKGYPLLEIRYENNEMATALSCETEIVWANPAE